MSPVWPNKTPVTPPTMNLTLSLSKGELTEGWARRK